MAKTSKHTTKQEPPGSKNRVLSDLQRYVDHPDVPMVSHGVASNRLASTSNLNISPSKLYEDGGKKLNVVAYLAERGSQTSFPLDKSGIFKSLEEFFTFCGQHQVPPTIGGFAVWNGVSVQRVNQIERDRSDERSEWITVCKDAIRNFLEISAMDNTLNPIVYFHQNKVYYGAIETNVQVNIGVDDNSREVSDEEYRERLITLTPDSEGIYR